MSDTTDMPALLRLPCEVLFEIASLLDAPDLRRLALASRHVVAPVYTVLYETVDLYLPRPEGGGVRDVQTERYGQVRMLCFLRTMIERPDLAQKVKSIRLRMYGGRMYNHNNSFRSIMPTFDLDSVHQAVMEAWEAMDHPVDYDARICCCDESGSDRPGTFCKHLLEMLTKRMTDAYNYVLLHLLPNLRGIDLVGRAYHDYPCMTCSITDAVPPAYNNCKSLSIDYGTVSALPPWPPFLQQLHLRGRSALGYPSPGSFPTDLPPAPQLQSLTLEVPLLRGFVDDRDPFMDTAMLDWPGFGTPRESFREWLPDLAKGLQCEMLRRLELIMVRATVGAIFSNFQTITDAAMTTFPNLEQLTLSPSYSMYYDRSPIPSHIRIQSIKDPIPLRRLTLTQLLLEDQRDEGHCGCGRCIAFIRFGRAPVGGFDPHTYHSEKWRKMFKSDAEPNSKPYHYPVMQAAFPNLEHLDIWIHAANPSTLVFFQQLYDGRDNFPSLRYVGVRVPMADDIPYTSIRGHLRHFVPLFRSVGILFQFSRDSLWPAEDMQRKWKVANELGDHEKAIKEAREREESHARRHLMPPLRVLRQYYSRPGDSPWGYHPDWNLNPEPLGEEAWEEVWTAVRALLA
ncbi:uncharacterized protein EI97DRAFT_38544 [Westerdykella ornata]|uniref:F-box domain-containing protein n=1 Tax=Westerdykella ornata TaxID=318751 RepID=A0A6A6JNA8_WESOR|nr:uncharacterized protein EI97DRAFT_38544 [Westerdykella ornata]KAF2276409.1 hypothetical protein EI97DRAFT_38544 [Westerdykella ornata]